MVVRMRGEQAFGKWLDNERLFVLHGDPSEQMFGEGEAMSVALELEYEALYPRLQVVQFTKERTSRVSSRVQRRRIVAAVIVLALLVLLMLPIRALAGTTVGGSGPVMGQIYVVQSGDTLASIARQADPSNVPGMVAHLSQEAGSTVVVPGEHLLIP
jgi:hypothetical protein